MASTRNEPSSRAHTWKERENLIVGRAPRIHSPLPDLEGGRAWCPRPPYLHGNGRGHEHDTNEIESLEVGRRWDGSL